MTDLELTTEDLDDALPGKRIDPDLKYPTVAAREKLSHALVEVGYGIEAARAASQAIHDPSDAIRKLTNPSRLGVPGGYLKYIDVGVLAGTVMPAPTNPRVAATVSYPAAGGSIEAPLETRAAPDGSPTLVVRSRSRESFDHTANAASTYIRQFNDLEASIQSQGVHLAITIVPTALEYADGSDPQCVMTSIDGSSRLSACLRLWGFSSRDVVSFTERPEKLALARKELHRKLLQDASEITAAEFGQARTRVVPAQLIVGWDAEEAGLGFKSLLDAYLGLLHVEPPTPWGEAAEGDKRAEAILDELERARRITPARRRYLEGLMTPEEAGDAEFDPTLDGRAADIFFEFTKRANSNKINQALRRVGTKNPQPDDRLEVATELAIRVYRTQASDNSRRTPRQALPAAMARLRPEQPWFRDMSDVESLRDTALEGLESGDGSEASELKVRGAFWLTRYSALQKSSRTDTRDSGELLRDLAGTEQGLHQLFQAIVDGRDGLAPRRVSGSGKLIEDGFGQHVEVTDQWLRDQFEQSRPPEDEAAEDPDHDPTTTLHLRTFAIRDDSKSLLMKVQGLESITESDDERSRALVNEFGIDQPLVAEITANLEDAKRLLYGYGHTWEQKAKDSGSLS